MHRPRLPPSLPLPYATAADRLARDAFFAHRPAAGELWDALAREAATWGPVQVTATKVRVCLLGRTRFLYCPQAFADGAIFVRFLHPERIDDARLRIDAHGNRWSHRVKLRGLDDESLGWFRDAYHWDTAA